MASSVHVPFIVPLHLRKKKDDSSLGWDMWQISLRPKRGLSLRWPISQRVWGTCAKSSLVLADASLEMSHVPLSPWKLNRGATWRGWGAEMAVILVPRDDYQPAPLQRLQCSPLSPSRCRGGRRAKRKAETRNNPGQNRTQTNETSNGNTNKHTHKHWMNQSMNHFMFVPPSLIPNKGNQMTSSKEIAT